MTEYSGRTTAYAHKFDDWQTRDISDVDPAVSQVSVFNAQWTDCPVEVEKEVKHLWGWQDLKNDVCYFRWDRDAKHAFILGDRYAPKGPEGLTEEEADNGVPLRLLYPLIDEYLMSKGVEKCLIHWWW